MFPKPWISFMIFLWWLKGLIQRVEGAEVGWTQSCFSPQLLYVGKLGHSSPDLDLCFSLYIPFFPSPQHKPRPGPLRRVVRIPPYGVSPTLSQDPSLPCWSLPVSFKRISMQCLFLSGVFPGGRIKSFQLPFQEPPHP